MYVCKVVPLFLFRSLSVPKYLFISLSRFSIGEKNHNNRNVKFIAFENPVLNTDFQHKVLFLFIDMVFS